MGDRDLQKIPTDILKRSATNKKHKSSLSLKAPPYLVTRSQILVFGLSIEAHPPHKTTTKGPQTLKTGPTPLDFTHFRIFA